jgi:hypothetical protein
MRPRYWCPPRSTGSWYRASLQVKSLRDTPSPSCSKLQTAGPRCRVFIYCYTVRRTLSFAAYTVKYNHLLHPSGHYMYRTLVTICTVQWSLYVPPSGHYTYRTVVTICTAQWSLYVPHSGHYMYRTVVTIYTTSLTSNNSTFSPHTVFMCFVWISEQTAIISLYNINWLVCITETECVYCAVRTECLKVFQTNFLLHSSTVGPWPSVMFTHCTSTSSPIFPLPNKLFNNQAPRIVRKRYS